MTLKSYAFPILLLLSIILGGLAGYVLGPKALHLKPYGDLFLNLILTAIVPLIFFSVSSAIARIESVNKLKTILIYTFIVFLVTGLIAALYALCIVELFPPAQNLQLPLPLSEKRTSIDFANQIASIFTVSDFSKLLSHEHILPLILFSILVGLAVTKTDNQDKTFLRFLQAGESIFMKVFQLIMYLAPLGFFAYFAVLVSELGTQLVSSYLNITLTYYLCALLYFAIILSGYAYFAGKYSGVKLFWNNIFLPAITAIATCSSAASIPANLSAAKNMQIDRTIYETSIPLGSLIHKEGSIIGGMFKIAFLFAVFHLSFSGFSVLILAVGVSILVGTVMGAIPGGGMLGELLILNVYGFPPSALIAIAAISIIIDPIATMLNVTGNTACSMIIAKLANGTSTHSSTNPSP